MKTQKAESCDCNVLHDEVVKKVMKNFPSEKLFDKAAGFFKAMGDPTRTKILWCLSNNEMCVCDIASVLDMTKSAISHQLAKLKESNMVVSRKDGKEVFYSLADEHVKNMLEAAMEHSAE